MKLREFVWVGGCVTAPAMWASPPGRRRRSVHKSVEMASRCRFGAFVYTVALLWTTVGTQECTQIGGNGLSVPFWGICVHCCAVVDNRGDAGVYTNRWKWPLGAVLGHLCTLLRRESRYESRRELRQVARAPQPPWRAGGTSSLVPLAWSENQALSEWRRC